MRKNIYIHISPPEGKKIKHTILCERSVFHSQHARPMCISEQLKCRNLFYIEEVLCDSCSLESKDKFGIQTSSG